MGDSLRITEIIFEVKRYPKIFDSMRSEWSISHNPPKKCFAPPRPPPYRGDRGVGALLISPTTSNFFRGQVV